MKLFYNQELKKTISYLSLRDVVLRAYRGSIGLKIKMIQIEQLHLKDFLDKKLLILILSTNFLLLYPLILRKIEQLRRLLLLLIIFQVKP